MLKTLFNTMQTNARVKSRVHITLQEIQRDIHFKCPGPETWWGKLKIMKK